MNGVYVDENSNLILVTPMQDQAYCVYSIDDTTMVTLDDKVVKTDSAMAFYDGEKSIVWDNGNKWKRVQMSGLQFHMLTYRPYVPLTLVLYRTAKMLMTKLATVVQCHFF